MLRSIFIATTFAAVTLFCTGAAAENAVTADPAHYKVELENDKVRIIRVKYGPGEKSVMHEHGPNAWVFLSGGDMRMTLADGTSQVLTAQPGEVGWSDYDNHLPENVGDAPVEVVIVELKE